MNEREIMNEGFGRKEGRKENIQDGTMKGKRENE